MSNTVLFYYRVLYNDGSEFYDKPKAISVRLARDLVIVDFLEKVNQNPSFKDFDPNILEVYKNFDDFKNRNTVKSLATKTTIAGLGSEEEPVILVVPKGILY